MTSMQATFQTVSVQRLLPPRHWGSQGERRRSRAHLHQPQWLHGAAEDWRRQSVAKRVCNLFPWTVIRVSVDLVISSNIYFLCFPAPKKVEFCYLSQLRRSPYPINGVYRTYHRAAHNHFKRHADIKHRGTQHSTSPSSISSLPPPDSQSPFSPSNSEEERTSAYDIASKKSNWQRATGWKLHHFESQLDEMVGTRCFH